jgi:hypothetical protein
MADPPPPPPPDTSAGHSQSCSPSDFHSNAVRITHAVANTRIWNMCVVLVRFIQLFVRKMYDYVLSSNTSHDNNKGLCACLSNN